MAEPSEGSWIAGIATTAALAICLAAAPGLVAAALHPWAGAAVAVGSVAGWLRWGPRPLPGLLPGIVSLGGILAIAASLLAGTLRP